MFYEEVNPHHFCLNDTSIFSFVLFQHVSDFLSFNFRSLFPTRHILNVFFTFAVLRYIVAPTAGDLQVRITGVAVGVILTGCGRKNARKILQILWFEFLVVSDFPRL